MIHFSIAQYFDFPGYITLLEIFLYSKNEVLYHCVWFWGNLWNMKTDIKKITRTRNNLNFVCANALSVQRRRILQTAYGIFRGVCCWIVVKRRAWTEVIGIAILKPTHFFHLFRWNVKGYNGREIKK